MEQREESKTPTNGQAAKRPYCHKHHRAMLDIGGEKKCVKCEEEKREQKADSLKGNPCPRNGMAGRS